MSHDMERFLFNNKYITSNLALLIFTLSLTHLSILYSLYRKSMGDNIDKYLTDKNINIYGK